MSDKVFALTICGYRKPDMDEDKYHTYLSENHAPLLKDLLIKNKIIDYTMVHFLPLVNSAMKLNTRTILMKNSNTTRAKPRR